MSTETLWVVDLEGSGNQPPEIVELAMIPLRDMKIAPQRFHWLVRPRLPIAPSATRIHGITDEDVAGAPDIDDISDDIVGPLEGHAIVGHNVRVDLDVLSRSVAEWRPPPAAFDTLRIAKILRPGQPSYALSKLGASFGLDAKAARLTDRGSHSALYDATLTALLFIELVKPLTVVRRQDVLREADILHRPQGTLL